jgi:hypothetical protein
MKIIYNEILPFKGFRAMLLFGVIFARKEYKPLSEIVINHEKIHAAQAHDCKGWIWFYLLYIWFYARYGFSYIRNPFEREAYYYQGHFNYLNTRKYKGWEEFLK